MSVTTQWVIATFLVMVVKNLAVTICGAPQALVYLLIIFDILFLVVLAEAVVDYIKERRNRPE